MSTPIPFDQRPQGKTLCLFDVDGTLSLARKSATPEMLALLKELRKKCVIGFLGGSDFKKIEEQLAPNGEDVTKEFDFCFAENGLTAYRLGVELPSQSFIGYLGEERYKKLVKFVLHYMADLEIPIKRGTFMEFRRGMVNISPIGRNASAQERDEFEAYDKIHKVRAALVEQLQKEFADYGLTFSIGGQISFDAFPNGWDKTFALTHLTTESFETIHFFGDKTYKGGNDYEIYTDERTEGHSVENPNDTMRILRELFQLS
ncbi:putative phosphomannomutase [Meredithblackwellia eburnea MCA 4105]